MQIILFVNWIKIYIKTNMCTPQFRFKIQIKFKIKNFEILNINLIIGLINTTRKGLAKANISKSPLLLMLLLVNHGGRSCSSLDSKPPFAFHTLKDGQTPIEPSKPNISHLYVWKGLPFSALKAPLDKKEQGRLIRVWPSGHSRAKIHLHWSYNRPLSLFFSLHLIEK